ncbi:30S ribosomal protein S7 [candidate division WOR-1 bacterium RIFOXYA12_FULL_43_27]|uniref:Small ribosomal subunit protein uS7 n=1 Tax=candidate division WOR-1 bacterium RIFOXYC2_FULL_46_14 TaxID=1802587 RepID=A0A1F4U5R0_UNCSA|nr:MAG: 30S ribosomal protein S7 [candidate division WOR-1 bacterium RIFOXYA12_FULL_43_27]OGC20449.1 MAG: 30S ribosomal protein S7 [candidate division WOR-1 bacterium RIFOXYB2_FULL_46_45]OGC31814.1 MAG: 30S ribosomal protein S7 [candidate division WOR-1 bacterium RIFOXYA2_FULL_46_56]OGC40294.1 MAG: 30S ribosomal protein S7 [candidate division WOR-1 bacterium RIFOXYC2_FULL_46_14]
MPRGRSIIKRKIPKDAVYGSELLQKFINKLMWGGQKSKAEKIVYGSLLEAAAKIKKEPLQIFEQALKNTTPYMEVKARRVGGATYQVPIEVPKYRGVLLAMSWLRDAARKRPGKGMIDRLSQELIDACNNAGGAAKSRETMHKTAEANKAFAHFRW